MTTDLITTLAALRERYEVPMMELYEKNRRRKSAPIVAEYADAALAELAALLLAAGPVRCGECEWNEHCRNQDVLMECVEAESRNISPERLYCSLGKRKEADDG